MPDAPIQVKCDPETGLCELPDFSNESALEIKRDGETEIIYIGDPMCSWCWGISPQLHALEQYAEQSGIPFRLVMGGLRAGGGEEWNDKFKGFLRHHWEEVNQRSGQPFSYKLFERDTFNYDTEPACRAVVTVRELSPAKTHAFYELVQHYFYVKNEDPNELDFYQPICEKLDIDFNTFKTLFLSDKVKALTRNDFMQSQQWGIRGFPSVVLRKGSDLHLIARGYAGYEEMVERIGQVENDN